MTISYGGTGKVILFINFTMITYNDESRPLLLEPGPGLLFNCLQLLLLYTSLCTRMAKGWDKGNAQLGIVSLL
jgi:hypothetical protein